MSACKTVRIKPTEQIQCPGHDFVEINESDFDEKQHVLYDEDESHKADQVKKPKHK